AIAESCFSTYRRESVGCQVELKGELPAAALLFAETPSRIVLSAAASNLDQILDVAREHQVAAAAIGRTGGERLIIDVNGERAVDRSVAEIESAWRGVLPGMLETASIVAAEEK